MSGQEQPVHAPFVAHLGFELVQLADGSCQAQLVPKAEHLNTLGVVHGGVVMTLLDFSMAQAARTLEPNMGIVTIEMKTSFMKVSSGTLQAHAKVLQRTATMTFNEARIVDAHGHLCAHATGTFKFVRRSPAVQRMSSTPTPGD